MATITLYDKEFEILDFDAIKGNCFGFIYVTINNLNGMKYIGLHYKWRRGYLGSGNYFKSAVKKYGKENFTRYIIDTADSYEELVNLEAHYITEVFGIDLAKSSDWYNITSGLQRGGDTWAGMSEEDRKKRAEKVSKANRKRKMSEEQKADQSKRMRKAMANPKNRDKISKATKEAMADPEIRKRISEAKKGTKMNLTEEQLERKKEHGRKMAVNLNTGDPWNKGVPCDEDMKKRLSETMRGHFKVTFNEQVICEDLNAHGGYPGVAKALSDILGFKISKNLFIRILEEGVPYSGKKKEANGLVIERVN